MRDGGQRPPACPFRQVPRSGRKDRFSQPRSAGFDQIEHPIEIAGVIGVGHVIRGRMRREIREQAHRRFVPLRAQRLDPGDILRIHRNDQIKRREIIGGDLPRPQIRQVIPTPPRRGLHRPIGCLPDMPVGCACTVGAGLRKHGAEHAFGSG